MRIKELFATKNGAYVYKTIMPNKTPSGLLWHSTGADNPWVQRYAGDSSTTDKLIGANPNNNGFQQSTNNNAVNNKGETIPCPNAVMGLGTDGEMLTVKTLPDDYCPWCSGSGNASVAKQNGFGGNNANFLGFYQVEVCEDKSCKGTAYGRNNPYSDNEYAKKCYDEMVEFSAYFFKTYFEGDASKVTSKTLTSHSEGSSMGIASSHGDPWHWLGKYGYSDESLRNDVKAILEEGDNDESISTGGEVKPVPTQPTPPDAIISNAYKAVKGDTMTAIANRSGVTLDALIKANPQIKNPNVIYIGDVINIPAKSVPKKTVDEVVNEIWTGKGGWGNDPERKQKLIAYGGEEFRNEVQKKLNEM